MVFVYPGICHEICHVGKKILKKTTVSWNFHHTHFLEVGLTKIPGDHETISLVRHVGLHIDLIQEVFFGPLDLHLRV